jgi:hypothetical protein
MNWFQWHQKLQHLLRGALYNKRKCKKFSIKKDEIEKSKAEYGEVKDKQLRPKSKISLHQISKVSNTKFEA